MGSQCKLSCTESSLACAFPTMAITVLALLLSASPLVMGWACRDFCGPVQVKYPFGTGSGCGDPRFHNYVRCENERFIFTSHTGSYLIQSIDYRKHIMYIEDPIMSTCNSMQPSPSFGLDLSAPFRIQNDIFVLLGCSSTSCLYSDPQNHLCDMASAHICSSLYACPGVSGLNLPLYSPISSCCVYSPINLGPAAELNLPNLQCSSYTSIYSFGNDPTNPSQWRYGVALKYNYNVDNYTPSSCSDCENSNGVCGYTTGPYEIFICVCRNGINTTSNCYGQGYYVWGNAHSRLTSKIGIAGILSMMSIQFMFL